MYALTSMAIPDKCLHGMAVEKLKVDVMVMIQCLGSSDAQVNSQYMGVSSQLLFETPFQVPWTSFKYKLT
ncbi:hypothetical protein N7447_005205 [Penicillium robsamsonii]|uniref:uncharacterized protein n=1 Tax=Penicillium robsamsonii TaxID=1792511 RepID=UPI002547BF5F|nr:uncharacterized protein N7447_005205 [Penicillium robsamsonii]KAJ5822865.1 hypothetical protein N7447_005205 [Penicillium robsamsonii]